MNKMNLKSLQMAPSWEWPEDAGPVILTVLRDSDATPEDRLLAAELAGDFVAADDELILGLLSVVGDEDAPDKLRALSAISLGPALEYGYMDFMDEADIDEDVLGYGDPPITVETFDRVRDTLRKLYHSGGAPELVRRRILEASVRAPDAWHVDAVRGAYYSGDDAWKLTGVFCMQYVKGFEKEILQALKSGDDQVHYRAVCAAGNWELDAAWEHVVSLVDPPHPDKDMLLAGIEAVAAIRPREAPAVLGDLLEAGDEDVVAAVYEALMMAEGELELEDEDGEDLIG